MDEEELNKIIEILESKSSNDIASFGLYYRDGEDEMYIKANKDGFKLFAAELLKASRDSEKIINSAEKNYIDFGWKKKWISGELIAYIKPISENRNEIKEDKPHVTSYKDDLFKYGCLTLITIMAIGIAVGFYTIYEWLFK